MLLHCLDHLFQLVLGTNIDAPHSKQPHQRVHQGLLGARARQHANDRDDALHLDGVDALRHGTLAANLEDVLDAFAVVAQLARRLAPVRVLAVVDDVVGAELLEDLSLLGRRRGRDDGCTSRFGKLPLLVSLPCFAAQTKRRTTNLQRKQRHPARPLHQHRLPLLQPAQPVQCIPARQRGARQCRSLDKVHVARHAHDALLVERGVLPQRAVDAPAQPSHAGRHVDQATLVALVEERDDVVAGLPLGHGGTDRDDGSGAVGAGHDGRLLAEDVFTLLC